MEALNEKIWSNKHKGGTIHHYHNPTFLNFQGSNIWFFSITYGVKGSKFIIPCIYIVRQDIVAIVIILIIVIQMVIIDVSGLIMTFTPERLVNLIYSKILQTQLVSYARFIEYGELYTLFQVIGGWMMKYIV